MKSTIALSLILLFSFAGIAQSTSNDIKASNGIKRFRVAAAAGWGYQLGKVTPGLSDEVTDYTEQLRNGVQFSGSVDYFIMKNFGLGLEFAGFRATNEANVMVVDEQLLGIYDQILIRDDIAMDFFGLSANARFFLLNDKLSIIPSVSFGQITYRNSASYYDSSKLRGTAPGFIFDLNLDAALTDKFSFVVGASTQQGVLNFVDYTDKMGTTTRIALSKDNQKSLSRVGVSCGFSIKF